jgi:DNA-binding transcriptional MerR regulator
MFSPAKRGDTPKNKYRYYSPLQITTVKMIRVLTEIGVPLLTIRELAQRRTPEKLIKILSQNKSKVASEIRFLQEVHAIIDTVTELLNEGMSAIETEITVSEMPEKRILLGNVNDFHSEVGFMREFLHFCNNPDLCVNKSFPIGGYFESMDVFLKEPSHPTRFFSIDPNGDGRKPEGLYLIGYTRGYYGKTNDLPHKMAAYAKKNKLTITGPVYNIYLFDEISEPDPERYLLQVSMPVTETRRLSSRRPRR